MIKSKCHKCFKSLGIRSRAKIYIDLCDHEQRNVSEITNFVGLRQPTVSYHLKGMIESGLLSKQQKGKQVYFSVNKTCPHYDHVCVLR